MQQKSGKSNDLALLICVERGKLEQQGILFAESVRTWAGALSETAIYAFAPRAESHPGGGTIDRLRDLDVTYVDEPLSPRPRRPTLNKAFVSAWAERELSEEILAFSDSDTVLMNEPAELVSGEWAFAARPVDNRNAGSTGPGDPNEEFWMRMYRELGVRSEPFVEAAVEGDRIRAMWNAGLIAARRSAGLFTRWAAAVEKLFDADVIYRRRPRFMDQLAFAAVSADHHEAARILPRTYNYPLPKRSFLPDPEAELDLDDLVHVHYHRWFNLPGFLDQLLPALDPESERYRWLSARLPLEPTIDEPFRWAEVQRRRYG